MNIIITGASQGIGYVTALHFAEQGHNVLAIARNKEKLKSLQQKAPQSIDVLVCDINDADKVYQHIESKAWRVDVLINNAGYLVNKPFLEITDDDLQQVYRTNVFAPFKLIQKLYSSFSKNAHIINIGSVGGVNGTQKFPGLTAYSSSKASISCLTECLQAEFSEKTNLTFNSLALGAVKTEMLQQAFPGYEPEISPNQMAEYIYNFALTAPFVQRGQTIMVTKSTP